MTKLVFLDTETTGLNHEVCEIWEIGAIVRDGGRPDAEYLWQIRPSLEFAEPNGLRIGRYYERTELGPDSEGAAIRIAHPRMGEIGRPTNAAGVAWELAQMLDGAFLVGAVPWFDERFLQAFLRQYGQAATNRYHLVDVENLAAGQLRLPPPWDFDSILAEFGLAVDDADRHTALGDTRMVRALYDAVMSHG